MTDHWLKTWPEPWQAVAEGRKNFEVRRDDRGFKVGDTLRLLLWQPSCHAFGGHYLGINGRPSLDREHDAAAIVATVTYVLPGGRHGIAQEFCVMGLRVTEVRSAGKPPTRVAMWTHQEGSCEGSNHHPAQTIVES